VFFRVTLDKLIETSLVLTPRSERQENFFLDFELISSGRSDIRRYYQLDITGGSRQISLYSYFEDISQMLATTDSQDAVIRLRVESDVEHLRLDIVRHNAYLQGPLDNCYTLAGAPTEAIDNDIRLLGIKVSDPDCKPVTIKEAETEGVGIGQFQIPYKMMKEGPWLLVPEKGNEIRFRPSLYLTEDVKDLTLQPASSLHDAARRYHPEKNPNAFLDVICLMALDWGNSGWSYLASLKDRYGYLPLSSFECWKALVADEQALASACFRLEMDAQFCTRIANELAVIWELITIPTWQSTMSCYRGYLRESGIDDTFIDKLLEQRVTMLASAIPCFKYLAHPLLTEDLSTLPIPPLVVLPGWFQGLRRRHADDSYWPTWFANELEAWLAQSKLPVEAKQMADVTFSRSVAYMPIFMAYLTAGVARLEDLADETSETRFAIKVLADFDREGWYEPVYSTTLTNLLMNNI
jgi:hypothetical protein